jgi:hypothetical protein
MPTADAPPDRFAAGDTLRWRYASADYPANDGWVLSYRLVGAGVALTIAASADGAGFIAEATAAQTAVLSVPAAGVPCTLIGYVSKDAERWAVYRAPCLVQPNPATITGDLRGHATKMLEAINALLEGRATKDQQSYRIGDRELTRIPVPELLKLRDYYKAEAQRETNAAALASGVGRPRTILTRFGRG